MMEKASSLKKKVEIFMRMLKAPVDIGVSTILKAYLAISKTVWYLECKCTAIQEKYFCFNVWEAYELKNYVGQTNYFDSISKIEWNGCWFYKITFYTILFK